MIPDEQNLQTCTTISLILQRCHPEFKEKLWEIYRLLLNSGWSSPSPPAKMFLEVDTLALTSGGLEILFSNKRRHDISIPASMDSGKGPNITYLLRHLVDNVIKDERKELFVLDGHLYVDVTNLSTGWHGVHCPYLC